MPPKAKFTKEEILSAALQITRESGIKAVTARELGARLGSSARPVFTVFQDMEQVRQEIIGAARGIYNRYVEKGLKQIPAFKGVGAEYIRFALEEPKLFQLLFMEEQKEVPGLTGILPLIDENYETILSSVQKPYKLEEAQAHKLYQHLWVYTHGIAVLCATKMCQFSEAEISEMLTEVFISLLQRIREGEIE